MLLFGYLSLYATIFFIFILKNYLLIDIIEINIKVFSPDIKEYNNNNYNQPITIEVEQNVFYKFIKLFNTFPIYFK